MTERISEIFPDTPVSYILHKCEDLDLVDKTIERITGELILYTNPPSHWGEELQVWVLVPELITELAA